MRRRPLFLALLTLYSCAAIAQESQTQADFRGEATRFKQSCEDFSMKKLPGCAELLFTDHPLHIAVGSIAPQNGFGAGGAYVGHYTPNELWRTSWDADAIASDNGSWRASFYYKAIHTPIEKIKVVTTTSGPPTHSDLSVHPYRIFNLTAQSISLNQLFFYGLGPDSLQANASVFGMTETITGGNAIVPLGHSLNASLLGEANGRFVNLRGNHSESSPSIEQLFTETTAPGLTTQPAVAQFGEGIRLEPALFNDHWQIDYLAQFQQYVTPSDGNYTFRRLNFDLDNTIPLYRNSASYGPKPPTDPTTAPPPSAPPSAPLSSATAEAQLNCACSSQSQWRRPEASFPSITSQPSAARTSTATPGSQATVTTASAHPTHWFCGKPSNIRSGVPSVSLFLPTRAKSPSCETMSILISWPTVFPSALLCALEACRRSLSPLPGVAPRAHTRLPT